MDNEQIINKSAELSRKIFLLAKSEGATYTELIHACKVVAAVCCESINEAPSNDVQESL